jgi:hypothetical protein
MSLSLPTVGERHTLVPRLLVAMVAALSLVLGPLAFAPAQAATVSVSGVLEIAGESPEGFDVNLQVWQGDQDYGYWEDLGSSKVTDAEGAYEFTDVPSGPRYRVMSGGKIDPEMGYTNRYAANETVEFEVTDVPATAPTLTMAVGGTIGGFTSADSGSGGLPGVRVIAARFLDGRYQYERETTSDEDGNYSVIGLRDGDYRLRFEADGYLSEYFDNVPVEDDATGFNVITIAAGSDANEADASLTPAAVVRGQVSGPDGPLQGIIVSAYRKVVDEDGTSWQSFQRYASTDEGGSYAIDDLPAGTYRIGFVDYDGNFVEEFYNDKAAVDAAGVEEFTLATGETAPKSVDALLAPAGFISGTLVDPAGDGLDSGCAFALGLVDGEYRELGIPAFTNGSDEYVIRGLATGTYKVRFADCSGDGTFAPEYFDNQSTLAAATPLTVTAKQTLGDINGALALTPVVVPPAPPAPPAAPAPVAKKSASVKVSAKGAKKKATLTITVKASGVTPTGKITIKLGSKTLKTVTLKGGKAKVTLTKQKKGKRTYKVIYSGDSRVRTKTVNTSKVTIK